MTGRILQSDYITKLRLLLSYSRQLHEDSNKLLLLSCKRFKPPKLTVYALFLACIHSRIYERTKEFHQP